MNKQELENEEVRQEEKKTKKKKSIAKIFRRIFVVLSILGIVSWGALYAFNYSIGEEEVVSADGTPVTSKGKKTEINEFHIYFCFNSKL